MSKSVPFNLKLFEKITQIGIQLEHGIRNIFITFPVTSAKKVLPHPVV